MEGDRRARARPVSESQLSDLRNMRVLLEETRALAHDLAHHRRARLEAALGPASDEVERQIEDLRKSGAVDWHG